MSLLVFSFPRALGVFWLVTMEKNVGEGGRDLDEIWTKFGQDLDEIGTRFGRDLDEIWTRLGQGGRDWDEIGTRLGRGTRLG